MKRIALSLCLVLLLSVCCMPVLAGEDYELLENGDFETLTTHWEKYYQAAVDYCDTAHQGDAALQITHRQHSTDIAKQVITKQLEYYGSGTYELSAWVRLADPEAEPIDVMVAIGVYLKDGQKFWFSTGWATVTSEWTEVYGVVNINWSGELKEAEFYLVTPMDGDEDTTKNFRDMFLDDCSMKVIGFSGAPYEKPTQAPVTTEPETEVETQPETEVETESETEAQPESETDGESAPAPEQESGKIAAQTWVIAGTMAAVALILLGCGIALTVSYVRGKQNEAGN